LQEGTRIGGQVALEDDGAGLVEDAHGKSPGMQIDASVESVRLVVETHHGLLGVGGA
jgi:hypothetical protein